jgi:hypothetical protein
MWLATRSNLNARISSQTFYEIGTEALNRTPFHSQSSGYTNIYEVYSSSICYPSNCARHALNLYLKSNGKDKTIYLPNFICRDLMAVFLENNMHVKFFSVTKSLQPNFRHNVKCDFLLMVNFFGFPQDIHIYRKFARKSNAILIEDNAHGLYSKDKKYKLLGTRGDIGILSVRKSVTLPNTGMLLINNKKIKGIEDRPKYKREALLIFGKRIVKYLFRFLPTAIPISLLFIRNYFRKLITGEFWPRGNPNDEFMLPKNKYINKYFSKGAIPGKMETLLKENINGV